MESYKSFKYNKHKVQRNPELDRPLNKWYVDKKMLIEDLSQGMVERKRMSQMIMQSKRPGEGSKHPAAFLFDNQPYDPRDTFKGELTRRAMLTGEIPLGRGMKPDMYGYNWFKRQQGDLLDIAIERQTLNDELIPTYHWTSLVRRKPLTHCAIRGGGGGGNIPYFKFTWKPQK
jgi:hypothetical protein